MALIYEVNLEVDSRVAGEFASWLALHVEEMLRFDGFERVEWFDELDDLRTAGSTGSVSWTIHYRVSNEGALDQYFSEHAERMRQKGFDRFPGKFSASRRILRPHEAKGRDG